MKFHKICINTFKVIAKVKICHKDYAAVAETRVVTIPILFLFEKQPS